MHHELSRPARCASTRPRVPTSAGAAAPDAHTVVITLRSPTPYLPGLMAHPSTAPLHRASLEKSGERFARPGTQVTNGAFVATEWMQGSYIRAVRNVHYRENASNKLDGVKYIQIADENAGIGAASGASATSVCVSISSKMRSPAAMACW